MLSKDGSLKMQNIVLLCQYRSTCWFRNYGDTWATVGSCAQVGKCAYKWWCGIGGVLEPVQASPVIIEDHVF